MMQLRRIIKQELELFIFIPNKKKKNVLDKYFVKLLIVFSFHIEIDIMILFFIKKIKLKIFLFFFYYLCFSGNVS